MDDDDDDALFDSTHVAGVTARNADGSDRQSIIARAARAGATIQLLREPDNDHDPNAIGVWIADTSAPNGRSQIGYIPADLAEELAEHLDDGGRIEAQIDAVTGGTADKPTRGVELEIKRG